jgi:hypothetical protein
MFGCHPRGGASGRRQQQPREHDLRVHGRRAFRAWKQHREAPFLVGARRIVIGPLSVMIVVASTIPVNASPATKARSPVHVRRLNPFRRCCSPMDMPTLGRPDREV